MKAVLQITENRYAFQSEVRFKSRNVQPVGYVIEIASHVGPKIWNSIPGKYKEYDSLNEFKAKIKTWYPENYPHKLCKILFIMQVIFRTCFLFLVALFSNYYAIVILVILCS